MAVSINFSVSVIFSLSVLLAFFADGGSPTLMSSTGSIVATTRSATTTLDGVAPNTTISSFSQSSNSDETTAPSFCPDATLSASAHPSIPVTTHTISPLPLPSSDVSRCLSNQDLLAAKRHDFYPLCNVDIPGQDIYPFIWAGNFDVCLEYCDAFNRAGDEGFRFNGRSAEKNTQVERGEKIRCKAALFVPTRVLVENDCYLKWGLDEAVKTGGMLWIVGGVKRRDQDEEGEGVTVNGTMTRNVAQIVTTAKDAVTTEEEKMDLDSMTAAPSVGNQAMSNNAGGGGGEDKNWLASILTLSTPNPIIHRRCLESRYPRCYSEKASTRSKLHRCSHQYLI